MWGIREIEISTIVAETVIIGIFVLPSPVLRGQLAIPRIFGRDVLAFIVMQGVRETGCGVSGAYLHRKNADTKIRMFEWCCSAVRTM